jgi:hypothetical protein
MTMRLVLLLEGSSSYSSISHHSFSASNFLCSCTSCERPCVGLAVSNRASITSGGLGGGRAPQKFPEPTQPHKNFSVGACFFEAFAGEPTTASSCQSGLIKLLLEAGRLWRDCITITRAKMTISSRSFAPNSKREDHVVLLSLAEVFREYLGSCRTDSLLWNFPETSRLLR